MPALQSVENLFGGNAGPRIVESLLYFATQDVLRNYVLRIDFILFLALHQCRPLLGSYSELPLPYPCHKGSKKEPSNPCHA
jgi:hypothetical protein